MRTRIDAWIERRHRIGADPVTLERQRIYILPTRGGFGFGVVLLVMLLWAINYSNNLAHALVFLLVALGLNAMWRTRNSLLDLTLTPDPPTAAFAGGQARFRYHLDHTDPLPRIGVGVNLPGRPARHVDVPPHAGATVTLTLDATHRGWLRPGRLRISSSFPLGLFRAWSWARFEQVCLVYPQPLGDLPLPLDGADGAPVPRQPAAGGRLGSDDFAGLRDYRPGDPRQRIAWRASVRGGHAPLQVKQFQGESPQGESLWLDWERIPAGDPEARLSQLCRWVLQADAAGYRYGLRLPGLTIDQAGAGDPRQRSRCLRALALYGRSGAA